MRARVVGIRAGVVVMLAGGATGVATSGAPAEEQPAAAVEAKPVVPEPPSTPRVMGPQQRLLDVAGERQHAREKPMPGPRPVKLKKPPKKVNGKEARSLAAQVRQGADTPEAHLVRAYRKAPSFAPAGCGVTPELLAAIGQVESGNVGGRGLTGHAVTPGVYGPPLTGGAFARISDSDGGRLDGSSAYDRAVGPMQFIPTTWAMWGTDADGDGRADPQNVYDAAASAARYLCAGGRDLGSTESLRSAILSYNYSGEYVATVLSWKGFFERNGLEAIGDTSRFVPNGVVTATTQSRDEHAGDPVVRPGPKDTVPVATPSPSSTGRPTGGPASPTPTSPAPGTGTGSPSGPASPTSSPSSPSPSGEPTQPTGTTTDPAATDPPPAEEPSGPPPAEPPGATEDETGGPAPDAALGTAASAAP